MKSKTCHIYAGLLSALIWFGAGGAYADGIHDAVRAGDVGKVEAMLSAAPTLVNSRTKGRAAPLHWACMNGDVEMTKALLKHGAAIDPAMDMGFTPLHCAIVGGSAEIVRDLIDAGADVDAATDRGFTCLHMAVKNDLREVARVLMAKGADPGVKAKDNSTPLSWAQDKNLVEMTAILKTPSSSSFTGPRLRPREVEPDVNGGSRLPERVERVSRGNPERRSSVGNSVSRNDVEVRVADGATYRGPMKNGKMHGHGLLVFPDGERYEGEFVDGQKHGTGLTQFPNGEKYQGEWRRNKKNGFGAYVFPDGEKYEGQWQDDQMHGRGVYTYADGRVLDGYWQENRFVTGSRK